jgi:hypothetical protein
MAAGMYIAQADFQNMMDRSILRLMVSIGVPIASAVLIEQLPKTRVAQVPFAFQVEGQTLPAGTYAVKAGGLGRNIHIQNQKLTAAALNCARVKGKFGKAEPARLVFENAGGRYRLAEIWFDADGRGVVLANVAAHQRESLEQKSVWLQ